MKTHLPIQPIDNGMIEQDMYHMTHQVLLQRRVVIMRKSWTNQWRHSLCSPLTHLIVRMLAHLERCTKFCQLAKAANNTKSVKNERDGTEFHQILTKGAFFRDYSGIGILGIDGICVLLGAVHFTRMDRLRGIRLLGTDEIRVLLGNFWRAILRSSRHNSSS